MGVVYAAHDSELGRDVAIKLLRASFDDPRSHEHLRKEALALARLSHPNVVQVYEVGLHEGRAFIAMELVTGWTLRRWLARSSPQLDEILDVYMQAGAGLAAAHSVGLIHRDFKPDNVLLSTDGRPRVADFGLARTNMVPSSDSRPSEDGVVDDAVTGTTSVVGTPAYMSPEQALGRSLTPAADQYSFCVALYEALYHERPFASGVTPVAREHPRPPPAHTRIPRWLRSVLLKGLNTDPQARFPSMAGLLAALGTARARRRRRRWLGGFGVVVVVAVSGLGYQHYDVVRRTAACVATGNTIDALWNADVRATVRSNVAASGVSNATVVVDKALPVLDERALEWRDHATAACMNATVHDSWDPAQYDKAVWCLEDGYTQFSTAVTELTHADAAAVQRAVHTASDISSGQACVDEVSLANAVVPPGPTLREQVRDVRAAVSRARFLMLATKLPEGLEVAREALARAQAIGWPPLMAAAQLVEAQLLSRSGSYSEAESAATAAFMQAATSQTWEVAAAAATTLTFAVGSKQARSHEGKTWARLAAVAISHAGDPLGLREVRRLSSLGMVNGTAGEHAQARELAERALAGNDEALGGDNLGAVTLLTRLAGAQEAMGKYEDAEATYHRALAVANKQLGPGHPDLALTLANLGALRDVMGAPKEAEDLLNRALTISEEALGPEHPRVAKILRGLSALHWSARAYDKGRAAGSRALDIQRRAKVGQHEIAGSLETLALIELSTGEYAEAKVLLTRAAKLRESVFGPEHPQLASTLSNLATAHDRLGEVAESRARLEQAFAIVQKVRGPEHPQRAQILNNLGAVYRTLGDLRASLDYFGRALAIWEKTLGPEHPKISRTLSNLGAVHVALAEYDEARVLYERALVLRNKSLGPNDPRLAYTLTGLGATFDALGQPQAALEHFERAAVLRAQPDVEPVFLARTRLAWAKVLWDAPRGQGRARGQARELVGQARDAFLANGKASLEELEEAELWLQSHRR